MSTVQIQLCVHMYVHMHIYIYSYVYISLVYIKVGIDMCVKRSISLYIHMDREKRRKCVCIASACRNIWMFKPTTSYMFMYRYIYKSSHNMYTISSWRISRLDVTDWWSASHVWGSLLLFCLNLVLKFLYEITERCVMDINSIVTPGLNWCPFFSNLIPHQPDDDIPYQIKKESDFFAQSQRPTQEACTRRGGLVPCWVK